MFLSCFLVFFFKQKTAYEMRISDWSSDVCSSDLRVDLMVRTVDQLHLDVDDRIAGKEAVRDRFLDALVDGRDVFLRHDAADDRILELIALALLVRRDLEP